MRVEIHDEGFKPLQIVIDPGAYDIESTLETITLLCEQSGEPCDGARFRELILKARAFLAARRTVSGQDAIYQVISRGVCQDVTKEQYDTCEGKRYERRIVYAAPIPATERVAEPEAKADLLLIQTFVAAGTRFEVLPQRWSNGIYLGVNNHSNDLIRVSVEVVSNKSEVEDWEKWR